ncbi:uroporphyrinogen-III C-methyltransferase [Paenibacillus cremeus]|uniref:Uroporphyrinogen-III C-methyltransferase n=1 Tax=Paenibacillus cremeus TaxID=2163881 RepID=A0A559KI26_9BACL|nr:uroporphyrinogen-III C-methyltransferase [Paenibacillus cremeus]TVY11728.1 uroporphyrinogen-III C-methyltransferase [Paenibacillus cremeus]
MNRVGQVFFVGAGPGDPKLITIKGMECLQTSDVIIYDRLANPALLDYARPGTELIYCGKHPNHHYIQQEELNGMILRKALEGKRVTRLKGGDPCIFGRVMEEAEPLANHGIPFEIVPGITSGIAAPAYAGIPVTQRRTATSFAMVTGQVCHGNSISDAKWKAFAEGIDTIAFYMGMSNIEHICEQLIRHGKAAHTPVAVISWGTTEDQLTVTGTLDTIARIAREKEMPNPAIILVGEVVNAREKLAWVDEVTDDRSPHPIFPA